MGVFTAWAPRSAERFRGVANHVAFRPDLASAEDVAYIGGFGFNCYTWEANVYTGELMAGTTAYIGQAEGPDQQAQVLARPPAPGVPRALVGSPDYAAVPGWTFLFESYDRGVPPRGYFGVSWFPVLDLTAHPFSDYVASLDGRKNFWIWNAEETPTSEITAARRYLGT